MAGRKRKPTHMRLLEGNAGKRALPKGEPKPTVGKPRMPSHLSDEAKREWKRITGELEEMGLATKADRAALVLYCEAWATWVEATEQIGEHGAVHTTEKGYVHQSPWVGIRNTAWKQMKTILTEFGMTPSSRTKVAVPSKAEENPFEKFLSRKSGNG